MPQGAPCPEIVGQVLELTLYSTREKSSQNLETWVPGGPEVWPNCPPPLPCPQAASGLGPRAVSLQAGPGGRGGGCGAGAASGALSPRKPSHSLPRVGGQATGERLLSKLELQDQAQGMLRLPPRKEGAVRVLGRLPLPALLSQPPPGRTWGFWEPWGGGWQHLSRVTPGHVLSQQNRCDMPVGASAPLETPRCRDGHFLGGSASEFTVAAGSGCDTGRDQAGSSSSSPADAQGPTAVRSRLASGTHTIPSPLPSLPPSCAPPRPPRPARLHRTLL